MEINQPVKGCAEHNGGKHTITERPISRTDT
jgi:hypothetical protein